MRTSSIVVAVAVAMGSPARAEEPEPCRTVEVFVREGCPHCADAERFLEGLVERHPEVEVTLHDVAADREALVRLAEIGRERGLAGLSVPTFVVCDAVHVGFTRPETTGALLEELLGLSAPATLEVPGRFALEVPLIGTVRLDELGLPLFTVVLGLVDGFNPCAMWVLLFLLAVLVNLRDRARILLVAGTFVVVSGLAYYAFMAAWLNVFLLVGLSRAVQVVLGVVAIAVGSVHVKDFFAFHRGITLSIPESAKPGLYARVRAIVQAENLPAAVAGASVLAVLVNVVELLCTAGIPALYTQILTLRGLEPWQHYAYLALYDVAYMLDDSVMVGIVVVTLGRRKLAEREGRWLKLVSGVVIVALGLLLLVKPGWLAR